MPSNEHTTGVQDAFLRYRRAAMGAGVDWSKPAVGTGWQPPDREAVAAVFDVPAIPDDIALLYTQCAPGAGLFPDGGSIMPWPVDTGDRRRAVEMLSRSFGTPFPWLQQFPLVQTDYYVFTVVLHPGPHEGEVWRYEFAGDVPDPMRAAGDLTALLDEWTKSISAGVQVYSDVLGQLVADEALYVPGAYEELPQRYASREPSCDLRAFPDSVPALQLQEWQRDRGVDVELLTRHSSTTRYGEFLDDVYAVIANL